MSKKIVTTIEEYDSNGNIVKKTIKEETIDDEETIQQPIYYYPYYYPYYSPDEYKIPSISPKPICYVTRTGENHDV